MTGVAVRLPSPQPAFGLTTGIVRNFGNERASPSVGEHGSGFEVSRGQ